MNWKLIIIIIIIISKLASQSLAYSVIFPFNSFWTCFKFPCIPMYVDTIIFHKNVWIEDWKMSVIGHRWRIFAAPAFYTNYRPTYSITREFLSKNWSLTVRQKNLNQTIEIKWLEKKKNHKLVANRDKKNIKQSWKGGQKCFQDKLCPVARYPHCFFCILNDSRNCYLQSKLGWVINFLLRLSSLLLTALN